MNGWLIALYVAATIVALGLIAWGVTVAWAVSGYAHLIQGDFEPDNNESEDI